MTKPDAWFVNRVKNPGLDLEKTVKDVVRIKDKDTNLEGIKDSVSYEPTEPLYSAETIEEAIYKKIEELENHDPDSKASDSWTEAVNSEIRAGIEILEELLGEFKQKNAEGDE